MMIRKSLAASVTLAVCTAVLAVGAQQDPAKGKAGGPPQITQGKDGQPILPSKDLAKTEGEIAKQFSAFSNSLLTLQQRLANSRDEKDKARAAQLKQVLDQISTKDISKQFTEFVKFLGQQPLTNTKEIDEAVMRSMMLAKDLKDLLDLIRSDNGAGSRKEERIALEKLLKELDGRIQEQRIIGAQIQTNDKNVVASNQGEVKDKTADLADKFGKAGGQAPDPKDYKGTSKEGGAGQKAEGKPEGQQKDVASAGEAKKPGQEGGEAKPGEGKGEPKEGKGGAKDGKGGDPKAGQGKDGKGGDPKAGAGKDGGKGGDPKGGGDPKSGAGKDGGKGGDPKAGNPGGAKGEEKKDDKAGSAKSSPDAQAPKDAAGAKSGESPKDVAESKPGQPSAGQQGESKPGSDSKGQGEAKPGAGGKPKEGQPTPPDVAGGKSDNQPSPPGGAKDKDDTAQIKKKIQEGTQNQESVQDSIIKGKKDDAAKESDKAIDNLEQARKKLEALIRQLREEELERVLANLISRCQRMLAMQEEVLRGTVRVQFQAEAKPNEDGQRKISQDCLILSDDELKIVYEATKAIEILETEGSAVAFPVAFVQVREDMKFVQRRLKGKDVGEVTVAIEQDIIDTLKDMIKALEKAKQDMDKKKQDPKKQDPKEQDQKQQDQKLLDKIAELKMIKSMQLQVNARTQLYGKHYEGEQAMTDDIRAELRELAQRQERIFDVTRKVSKGDGP